MNTQKYHALRSILLATILLLPSCHYKHDTVSFEAIGKIPDVQTPVPQIYIDTNISIGSMMGGTVKSNKPYDIQAHYRDDTFTFATAEFSAVTVTYADGTNDPGAAGLKLPMRFQGRAHESHNSMAGGAVVVTKSRIIPAEFPGTVTRDEPFTLQIQGRFIKEDGSTIPFNIKQEYEVVRDKRTQTWAEFMSGC